MPCTSHPQPLGFHLYSCETTRGPVDPEQIGVDLVAFAVDSNPDVDPTQLTGDSRSTKSFQGRQTCIDSRVAYLLDRGSHPVNTIQAKYQQGEE